jgi:hypothetical protein
MAQGQKTVKKGLLLPIHNQHRCTQVLAPQACALLHMDAPQIRSAAGALKYTFSHQTHTNVWRHHSPSNGHQNTVTSRKTNRAPFSWVALTAASLIIFACPVANAQSVKSPNAAANEPNAAKPVRLTAAKDTNASALVSAEPANPVMALRAWKVSLKDLGVARPMGLRGVESEVSFGVGVRLDELVETAKLRLTFTLSPALIPTL